MRLGVNARRVVPGVRQGGDDNADDDRDGQVAHHRDGGHEPITNASVSGMRRRMRRLCQANVPITTMNMTPTSAASGICSIRPEATKMNASRHSAAVIPESLERPPDFTLIID